MFDAPEEIQADVSPLVGAAFRDARFIDADGAQIDMELDHPKHGWIPITINQEEYPALWPEVLASGPAPYVAPPEPTDAEKREAWRLTAFLSRAQFALATYRLGILPLEEAIGAGKGDWPASFTPILAAMPEGIDPGEAQILWAGITIVERLHPLFEAVRQFRGMTPEQADAMFGYEG